MSAEDFRILGAIYDGKVRWTDTQLAPLWQELERLRIYDDTVVVVLSDHGERLGEHGDVGHGELYEQELRVPLLMRLPAVPPRRIQAPVQLVDVEPTSLAQLGLPAPYPLDGIDLTPFARGEQASAAPRLWLSQSVRGDLALRLGKKWKLVIPKRRAPAKLYALHDPDRDIAAQHPEVVALLTREIDRLLGTSVPQPEEGIAPGTVEPELEERLRGLGYIE